jgi:hypothetical protein
MFIFLFSTKSERWKSSYCVCSNIIPSKTAHCEPQASARRFGYVPQGTVAFIAYFIWNSLRHLFLESMGCSWEFLRTKCWGRYEVIEKWQALHNDELYNFYSLPNIFTVIETKRMRWAGHVICMGKREMRTIFCEGGTLREETTLKT